MTKDNSTNVWPVRSDTSFQEKAGLNPLLWVFAVLLAGHNPNAVPVFAWGVILQNPTSIDIEL